MYHLRVITIVFLVAMVAAGCARDRSAQENADPHAGHAHAEESEHTEHAEGTAPMCEEHGVPEAACAICLPAVAPALLAAGETPESGVPLVRLASKQAASKAGLRTVPAAEAGGRAVVTALAQTLFDANRSARISSPATATIQAILVDLGQQVRAGDPLVVLSSAEIAGQRGELAAARAREALALSEAERFRRLREQDLASQRDVDTAEKGLDAARAERIAAEQMLQALLRSGEEAVESAASRGRLADDLDGDDRHVIRAPIGGTVVSRDALPGAVVETDATILQIADPSRLWVDLQVREEDALAVRAGLPVRASFDALPGAVFEGTTIGVAQEIDARTRFLLVRASIENSAGLLKANLFGRAVIDLGAGADGAVAAVPREAIQYVEDVPVLFVYMDDDLYEIRPARTGAQRDGRVEILQGVVPGERVVTDGAFLLKTQVSKGSIGAGCCDVVETLGRRR